MLARFGLGFKIPIKPLIIQALVALLFVYLTMPIPNVQAPIVEGSEILPVDGFVSELEEWYEVGAYPWLDVDDNETAYIFCDVITDLDHKYFTFQNVENVTRIDSVVFWFKYWDDLGYQALRVLFWYYTDGEGGWGEGTNFSIKSSTWVFKSKDMTNRANTTYGINNMRVWFDSLQTDSLRNVTYAYLNVTGLLRTPLPSYVDIYFGLGLFLAGVIMMIFAPSWVAWKVKKSGVTPDTVERLGYAMLIFIVGFGLFLSFIYGSGA